MDNLTQKIKVLNQIYKITKKNFDVLKKMFKKTSSIGQKIVLAEEMTNQVYMAIMESIEKDEINKQFIDIIKGIKNEKYKK